MNTLHALLGTALLLIGLAFAAGCDANPADANRPDAPVRTAASKTSAEPISVSGSAVHYFSTAIVHAQEPTATGMIQHSTDIIELTGDMQGYVLYHPTSVFDFSEGTLVNTGTQVFSGTIAGSEPVLLHDATFRFEVDLETNATTGKVHLGRSKDAPTGGSWYECDLTVVGTGVTPEGDNLSDYTGTCTPRGKAQGPGLK